MNEKNNTAANVLADNANDLAHGLLAKDGKPLDYIKSVTSLTHIYHHILPLYDKEDAKVDVEDHFKIFFDRYCQNIIDGGNEEFINKLKDVPFLVCKVMEFEEIKTGKMVRADIMGDEMEPEVIKKFKGYRAGRRYAKANEVYMPTPELEHYFIDMGETYLYHYHRGEAFINLELYKEKVGQDRVPQLINFLKELGVWDVLKLNLSYDISPMYQDDLENMVGDDIKTTVQPAFMEYDELGEFHYYFLCEGRAEDYPVLFWNTMLSLVKKSHELGKTLQELLQGTCYYFDGADRTCSYDSLFAMNLDQEGCFKDINGNTKHSSDLTLATLSKDYDISTPEAKEVLDYYGIK